jgi:hypothetical protein
MSSSNLSKRPEAPERCATLQQAAWMSKYFSLGSGTPGRWVLKVMYSSLI